MKRKIIPIIFSVLIMLSNLPSGMAAQPEITVVIEAPETLPGVGEEFNVVVWAENNPGFNLVQFLLVYPNDEMTCREIVLGELIPPGLAAVNPDKNGAAVLATISLEAIEGDGILAQCTFVVNSCSAKPDFRLEEALFSDELCETIPSHVELRLIKNDDSSSAPPPGGGTSQGGGGSSGQVPPSNPPAETGDPDPEPSAPGDEAVSFTDTVGHWGESYIIRAAQMGLFMGYPDGRFGPDDKVTRAQFVTVLWRAAGSPDPAEEHPFTDIADQIAEFQTAIRWAYGSGAVKGTSDTTFSPENVLTRQEALTILHRCAGGATGMEAMFTGIYDSAFSDSGEIASWAKAAMYWGVYHKVISGTGEKTLSPWMDTTRAQLAKIMVDYLDRFPANFE